eukprot:COSAG01_NODE_14535_length_1441_cov_0.794337_1_plen_46_part_10
MELAGNDGDVSFQPGGPEMFRHLEGKVFPRKVFRQGKQRKKSNHHL